MQQVSQWSNSTGREPAHRSTAAWVPRRSGAHRANPCYNEVKRL